MMKLKLRLARLLALLTLRARYYRKPISLQKIAFQEGYSVAWTLDVGSGPTPKNPFGANSVFGVDIRSFDVNPNVMKCALGIDRIPFTDDFFDAVTAYDVLEHIPRVATNGDVVAFPFVEAMNDIWRVLRVGGIFYSETPCFPMKEAFQDPTHVNIMTEDTLTLYFGESRWAKIYGFIGSFSVIKEGWIGNKYFCILKKTSAESFSNVNEPQK